MTGGNIIDNLGMKNVRRQGIMLGSEAKLYYLERFLSVLNVNAMEEKLESIQVQQMHQ
jgi:hypothetical protein